MQEASSLILSVLLGMSLLLAAPATANQVADKPPEVDCDGQTEMGVSKFSSRVEYVVTYNESTQRVCAVAKNTGDKNQSFGYSIWVDDARFIDSGSVKLAPDAEFKDNQSITDGLDATRDNHSVRVSSHNGTFYFNFTQKIDTMNEGGVPTPHIDNLTVQRNGTKSGQPKIIVDFENNGSRNYSPRAVVKTLGSSLRWMRGGGVQQGRFYTRLNEVNDAVIVGTVKLYGDTYYTGTKFDRVSFVSYPNGTYEIWEPAFEEIPTDREIEQREVYYENKSAKKKYRGPDVDPISESASRVGAVLVVLLVVVGVWYWRR